MSPIESLLSEKRIFFPPADLVKHATISGMPAYQALCDAALNDFQEFWAALATEHLQWKQPFTQVLNESKAPFYTWFEDGTLNASVNCLDKHMGTPCETKTAFIFEADDGSVSSITYKELLSRVCQFANALKVHGIQKGDRVIIYMPMCIETIVAMQACARIGAIHCVVFAGFSTFALCERIEDTEAIAVITANYQCRGGKVFPLKATVDESLLLLNENTVKHVFVYERIAELYPITSGRDKNFDELLKGQNDMCEPEIVGAEHPLFILYTSGSTGKPKGILHSTAGYLLWAKLTMDWTFDLKPKDIFWCTADVGWITGHTYITYGPLAAGATQLIFEGAPTYPHAGRFWEIIAKHRCSIFYTAPTAIRTLIKASDMDKKAHPSQYDLSSLRILGSVGEPFNPEAWMWYYQEVGGGCCPVVDTFWQTETGGHMITPLPGATPLVPGSCTLPLPGIMAAVVDETGQELPHGTGGMLVFTKPWPAMVRNIWGNPERYQKAYFPEELGGKLYLAGDSSVRSPDNGYFRIMGRTDDVLNISGHRLGTMELESALVSCSESVAEAAVVGRPDEITGEAICAFVVLKQMPKNEAQARDIAKQLRDWITKVIGSLAKPKDIRFAENLPKTRSGKIMRRLLRDLARGEAIAQDISTLENPAILEQFSSVY